MTEWLFALITGSYVYTFASTLRVARKSDVDKLQERIDRIYELLLNMNGNAEAEKKKKDDTN